MTAFSDTLAKIKAQSVSAGQFKSTWVIKPSPGKSVPFPNWIKPQLVEALIKSGVNSLYQHQKEAIEFSKSGKNLVVCTNTSSGKSLCYWIPVLNLLLEDNRNKILVLFPTKALARDQLKQLNLILNHSPELFSMVNPAIYDGDTPSSSRKNIRLESNIILSNPDSLHHSILPTHGKWIHFFSNLKYVILDETHVYSGVFGSHVSLVLKRMKRICRYLENSFSWILCSATMGNPEEIASLITGEPFESILIDHSQQSEKTFTIWNNYENFNSASDSKSIAAGMILHFMVKGYRMLIFTQTRLQCELLGKRIKDLAIKTDQSLEDKIAIYRAGYKAKERKEIEKKLASGFLGAVISTSALEMGIDIGSLDIVFVFGFPRSISSFYQQSGRAGRKENPGLTIFIPSRSPIDQYILTHPYFLKERPVESNFCDPENPYIITSHLQCASQEIPLSRADEIDFGINYLPALSQLEKKGILKEIKGKWYFPHSKTAAHQFSLRKMGNKTYNLVLNQKYPYLVGELDEHQFNRQCFIDSIYLSQGFTYRVTGISEQHLEVYLQESPFDYFTLPIMKTQLNFDKWEDNKNLKFGKKSIGNVTQYSWVEGLKKIHIQSGKALGLIPAERTINPLNTKGCVFSITSNYWDEISKIHDPLSGLVGIKNLVEETMAISTQVLKNDVQLHIDFSGDLPRLAILDIYPGGIGLVEKIFHHSEKIMQLTKNILISCPCEDGCISCIGIEPLELNKKQKIFPNKNSALEMIKGFLN